MTCKRGDSEVFDVKVLEFPWNYPIWIRIYICVTEKERGGELQVYWA